MSLKEYLASEAEKLRSEQSDAMKKREEWVASVGRLLAQIKEWLREADSRRILTIEEAPLRLREQRASGATMIPASHRARGRGRSASSRSLASWRDPDAIDRSHAYLASLRTCGYDEWIGEIHDIPNGEGARRSLDHHRAGRISTLSHSTGYLRVRIPETARMMTLDDAWRWYVTTKRQLKLFGRSVRNTGTTCPGTVRSAEMKAEGPRGRHHRRRRNSVWTTWMTSPS